MKAPQRPLGVALYPSARQRVDPTMNTLEKPTEPSAHTLLTNVPQPTTAVPAGHTAATCVKHARPFGLQLALRQGKPGEGGKG